MLLFSSILMVKFFKKEEEQQIIAAIKTAEKETSGEIRVHVEKELAGEVKNVAARVFHELEMDQTAERNGVLIFIVPSMRRFAIIGDKGINEKVPADFWEEVRDVMQEHFKLGQYGKGIIEGVRLSGEKLKEHFPWQSGDKNELPDEISYGQ